MVTREAEVWAATRTLAMHQDGGSCAHCTRDGCRMLVWAETMGPQPAPFPPDARCSGPRASPRPEPSFTLIGVQLPKLVRHERGHERPDASPFVDVVLTTFRDPGVAVDDLAIDRLIAAGVCPTVTPHDDERDDRQLASSRTSRSLRAKASGCPA